MKHKPYVGLAVMMFAMALVMGLHVGNATATYSYNRSAAVSYADTWATSHNSQYSDFSPNDCTNYVSQCLWNGGYPMYGVLNYQNVDDDTQWWWNFSYRTHTYSWSVAHKLYGFLCLNGHMTIKDSTSAWSGETVPQSIYNLGMRPGDVIFYDWSWNPYGSNSYDHAALQIMEGYDPNSWPSGTLVDYHTSYSGRYHVIWHVRPYNNYSWAARYQLCHIYDY